MITRKLIARKEVDSVNVEFKVERVEEDSIIVKESVDHIIDRINSGSYKYRIGDSKIYTTKQIIAELLITEDNGFYKELSSLPTYK